MSNLSVILLPFLTVQLEKNISFIASQCQLGFRKIIKGNEHRGCTIKFVPLQRR